MCVCVPVCLCPSVYMFISFSPFTLGPLITQPPGIPPHIVDTQSIFAEMHRRGIKNKFTAKWDPWGWCYRCYPGEALSFRGLSLLWLKSLFLVFYSTHYKFHLDGNLAGLLGLELLIDATLIGM